MEYLSTIKKMEKGITRLRKQLDEAKSGTKTSQNTHSYVYCGDKTEKWANSEYAELPVDWSKVAVDTPILVRDSANLEWTERYFAKYDNGVVYAWSNGTTSWTGDRHTSWKLAKLPDKEQ